MASRVGARDPAMINEQALKIQGWWRRILARKELIRRWTLAQKLDLKEEYDWQYAAGGKRIDVFGAQGLSNLENYEIMGRNGLMQEERMQWLELTRYLKYTQEQMMQAYPNVVFSQHEYVMRLQVMQEHSAELAAMVDHEETLMRSRLRNEEATLRIRIAHLTKTIWRQRQMKALNDEIRRRATLTREEDAAWKMKLGTHRRIVCGLEQLKALQALEEEEAQQRSEPTMEEALAWQAMQSAAKASVEEALQKTKEREANVHVEEQQEFVTGEEAARAEIIVEVLQQFVASTEMLEDAWRTEGVAAEQRTWEIHLALGALQIEELKERSEIAELWDSVLASDRSAKEQDLARIEFQRDGVFAEAKARVKIVLEEIDGWYLCLTEELKHREEVMRQQQTAEETEGYQGMVMELQCCQEEETKLQQVLGLNTEEEEERQQHEQAQQQQRDALYQSFDFLCGDTLFRERWRAQETLERDMLAAMIMREELEHDEAAERKLILAEEMRMQHFLQECTMARWEHIVRESIVGEEIEIRRLIQARDTKELAAARKAYLQAVQTRQEEEQSIFIIEESAMRQKIHNEQLQERRAIGTEAAEDRQRVIEAEVAADQAAAETADKHVRDRADLELDEMEGRQELEKSEIVDFIFLVGVRKLTKLERSTRRLIVEEQERKQMAIGNRAMLYHIEAAELAERAHFEGVDEGDRVGMAELYSKSRVQAEYAMLMRNVRLTQEEELADVEQFEAAFRQRVELQQADQRGDIALLAVESHEQIQRTTVEVLQVRGWAQKLAMDERQRGELEAAQEVTQRHKATMKFHKAMDHTKRERQLQEENEAQEERANLIQEETAERASLVKYESRLFDEIPFDACQEQEMLHRRSLLHTRQRWYQEFTQRLSCHKKFVDGLIDLDAEQTLAWQMLMCEWEETEARFELEVDDFMVRTGLFELLVIGIEEDAQRSRIRRSEDQRSQAMMKKMVVEAQMESRADLERTALRVRGHVAGYEAEEWQQDIVIAHLTGLLELQEPELRRRIGQREREAFLTYGFPWVELQESAARQALDSTCIGAIKALNADVRTAAAEQTLWMALRELQVDEAQLRRQTMHLEDEKRLVLQAERKADAEAIDEQLRRAQLLRKEHAMERLHLTLIERDARHSIQHNEDRSWQQVNDKFSRDFREVVAMMDLRSRNAMKKARAKQQAEEKARKEAESRAARMAALQALADDTLAAVEPLKTTSSGSFASRKRDEWAAQTSPLMPAAAPLMDDGVLDESTDSVSAAVMPLKEAPASQELVKRSAAGTPQTMDHGYLPSLKSTPEHAKLQAGAPTNHMRDQIKLLESLMGHSPRSVYSYYCREYDVPTKPQILAALPKQPGDFSLKALHIGSSPHSGPDFGPDVVTVRDVVPGNRGVLPILEVVRACPSLHTLVLRGCGIQSISVDWIVHCVVDHPNLTTLDLRDNKVSDLGMRSLIHLASKNPRMVSIQVDSMTTSTMQHGELSSALSTNLGTRANTLPPLLST